MFHISARAVEPHITLGLGGPPGFVQHLKFRVVRMEQIMPQQLPVEFIIDGRQPVFRAAEQPVGHGLPGKHDALPVPLLLLPARGRSHHEFLRGDVGDCFRRRVAAGDQHRFLRRPQDRRGYVVFLAAPAAIGIVNIPVQDDLGRYNLDRLLNFGPDGLHGLTALRAEAVVLRQDVFDLNGLRVFRENVPCAAGLLLPDMRTNLHGSLFRSGLFIGIDLRLIKEKPELFLHFP